MYNKKACGERIRFAREKNGISRSDMAEKLGITDKYLYQIEHGEKGLSTSRFVMICEILDVSADRILFGEDCHYGKSSLTGLIERCDRKKLPYLEKIIKAFIDAYYE